MCLGVPGRIDAWVDDDRLLARVELDGVPRDVNMVLLQDDAPEIGDWVLVHVGFATTLMAEQEAHELLATLREVEEQRRTDVAALVGDDGAAVSPPGAPAP